MLADPRRLARQVLGLALVAKAAGPEFGGQRVQGIAQDGSDLVISHSYIRHGLRSRVEEPRPPPSSAPSASIAREMEAKRWTWRSGLLHLVRDGRKKGWSWAPRRSGEAGPDSSRSRLFGAERRVVVKVRVVGQQGHAFRSVPLSAHVAYLERDGVARDGEKRCMLAAPGTAPTP